jgi:hypothetical protein
MEQQQDGIREISDVLALITLNCLDTTLSDEKVTEIRNNIYSLMVLFTKKDKVGSENLRLNIALNSVPKHWDKPDFIYKSDETWMLKFTPENRVWITDEGRFIPIENMAIKHILNTIKCLERKSITLQAGQETQWIEVFKEELKNRNKIKKNKP